MNHLNRIRCTVLMLLLTANLRAEVFVVTSNADSGPGTLRAALQQAADNGDTETDHIHFNLPGSGTDARTIRLLTRLPDVNSSLVIDGATQPGDALSINGAKIILTADMPEMDEETGYLYDQGAFWLKGSFQQFELYGMVIKGFRSLSEEGYYNDGQAIRVDAHIQTMVMGARGKGNVFYNNALTINVSVWEAASIHRMEMKNNFIGIDEAGHRIDGHLQSEVRLSYTKNLILGGEPDEGNIIMYTFMHSPNGVNNPGELHASDATFEIRNNVFGADAFGQGLPGPYMAGHHTYFSSGVDQDLDHSARVTFTIADNVWGYPVNVHGYRNANLQIKRNRFGATEDGHALPMYFHAIILQHVYGQTVIGGDTTADGNQFTNILRNDHAGYEAVVYATHAQKLTLSHNSMYCNTVYPFRRDNNMVGWHLIHEIDLTLDDVTASSVSGTATKPGSRIELFYTDKECESCYPKTYFATVYANAQGKWTYNGPVDPDRNVMAAATYQGQSSEFTYPQIYTWDEGFAVDHVTCDGDKGSIKGVLVKHAHEVEWLNEAGEVVGTTVDVDNLDPGMHYLKINQFGCEVVDSVYIERAIPWADPAGAEYVHPSCDRLGSIISYPYNYMWGVYWVDENENRVSDHVYPTDLPPGRYWVYIANNDGCEKKFGPFELIDQGGTPITVDDSGISITPASCGNPASGSITGLRITGATEFIWRNESSEIVGTAQALHNVPAGGYQLSLSNGPCQSETVYYYIDELPPTDFPAYNFRIQHAYCNEPNGAITVEFINDLKPTSLRWLDKDGQVAGTHEQLTGLPPGTYTLMLTDAQGCEVAYGTYTVEQTPALTVNALSVNIKYDECGLGTGHIIGLQGRGGMPPFRYEWVNENGTVVGQAANATGLTEGRYRLTITDANGCAVQSEAYVIPNSWSQLDAPQAPDVFYLCSPGQVTIPFTGIPDYRYRLYDVAQGGTPVAEGSGITTFEVHPTRTTTYYLVATNGMCESPRVPVRVEIGHTDLDIPNMFSPNGDGHNDTWHIPGLANYPDAHVSIFDRNGQLLYAQRAGEPAFDGRYKGADLPTGAYFYAIDLGMGCSLIRGALNLLR